MPIIGSKDYPYMSNLNADPRLLGFPSFLYPFQHKTSSPRADMHASQLPQALIIDGAEMPRLFTGFEHELGRYEYNPSARDQGGEVLAVIPKYQTHVGYAPIRANPQRIVVYLGEKDNTVHYCTVDRFVRGSNGFGYENQIPGEKYLYPNTHLPEEAVLTQSPAKRGARYMLGVNVNIAYLALMGTIEDAMWISQSLADRMTTTGVERLSLVFRASDHPLNLYGRDGEYKIMPDIGERVGDDGILCAIRPMNTQSFAADADPRTLGTLMEHDRPIYVEPGAEIVDIDVYPANHQQLSKSVYGQFDKYIKGAQQHYEAIIKVYQDNKHRKLSPAFNTLVTTAAERLMALSLPKYKVPGFPSRGSVKFMGRDNRPVDFLQVDITYVHKIKVSGAAKISDRAGAKGVVCKVVPNEDMPVDEYGIRADLVVDPSSPIARMNTGQLDECDINRASEFVRRRLQQELALNPAQAVATMLEYLRDINPNYADLVERVRPTLAERVRLVQELVRQGEQYSNGFDVNLPPYLDTLDDTFVARLWDKWGVRETPVRYAIRDRHDNRIEVTTDTPVSIGSRFTYLLCKMPDPTSPGVGRVSHHGIPIKPGKHARDQHPINPSPMREGEDEIRLLSLDIDGEEVQRLLAIQGNSLRGVQKTVETLFTTDQPSNLDRVPISTEELVASNAVVSMFQHICATIGVDVTYTRTNHPMPVPLDPNDTEGLDVGEAGDTSERLDVGGGPEDLSAYLNELGVELEQTAGEPVDDPGGDGGDADEAAGDEDDTEDELGGEDDLDDTDA